MLARLHDASTDVGAAVAAFCVVVTACIYTSEVVARYFLNAPLNWSGDVSSYLLCACTFLALPMVTRKNGHVAIGYFLERMSEAGATAVYAPARHRHRLGLRRDRDLHRHRGRRAVRAGRPHHPGHPHPEMADRGACLLRFRSAALHLFFPREAAVQKDAAV